MALQKEIWITEIQENLFPANDFMTRCTDHTAFLNYLTVHLPQSGANPAVFKNNTSLPVPVNQRNDTDFTYSLNNYKGEPILITNLEEMQNSYDKRSSVLGNVTRNMRFAIGNQTLYAWTPSGASRIVRTSGTASATALAPSATGTRNAITLNDISAMKAKLDNDNVPAEGRILMMPADMYNNQLLQINNIQAFYAYNMPVIQTGKAPTIFGFEILIRPSICVYDTSAVIKPINDLGNPLTPATTDNLACVAYHPDFVSKAEGAINVYAQMDIPQYYGSLLSIEVQHGASPLRSNSVGIVALVQQ